MPLYRPKEKKRKEKEKENSYKVRK